MKRTPTCTHSRAALLGHLVDKIQSSSDPDVVIAGARVLAENPDVGVSPDFLRAAIVDAVAVGRFDLAQVCRAVAVLIGDDSQKQGPDLLILSCYCTQSKLFTWPLAKLMRNVTFQLPQVHYCLRGH